MFFGSILFFFIAFKIGSSGDVFTKSAELAAFWSQGGRYEPKHENLTLKIGQFYALVYIF